MKTKSCYITLNRLAWHLDVVCLVFIKALLNRWMMSLAVLWTLHSSGRSHRPAGLHHSGGGLQIQTMVESSFQVLLKLDVNECGTGEGLQSVITQPQLQTYIHTHNIRQAGNPQRGEKYTLREKKPGILEEVRNTWLQTLIWQVMFVFCTAALRALNEEVDCVSFPGWRIPYMCLCVTCVYIIQWSLTVDFHVFLYLIL